MLVLSRKAGQSIKIGDQITLRVKRINGSAVRLSISAPADVRIIRSELLEQQPSAHPQTHLGADQ